MLTILITLIFFIPLCHAAETLANSVKKQKQIGSSTHLVFLEMMKNMIYLLNSNMTLSKSMQIQFYNQLGKYTLSVLEIGSIQPLKSLANCCFHICVCAISGQLHRHLLRLLFISDSSCHFSSGKISLFVPA